MTEKQADDYREKYNHTCHGFMVAGIKLLDSLDPIDVAGAMTAVSVELLKREGRTAEDVAEWLHALASAVETGEVGFEHKAH